MESILDQLTGPADIDADSTPVADIEPVVEPDSTEPAPVDAVDPQPVEPEPVEPEPVEPVGDEDAAWLQETGERLGIDLSKYQSQEAALAGLAAAAKKVGSRDEDAQVGRQLRGAIAGREEEFMAWYRGELPAPAAAPDDANGDMPKSYDEYQLLRSQVRTNDEGVVVPIAGAPADAVARYERTSKQIERQLFESALDPRGYAKTHLGFDPEAQQQSLQSNLAEIEIKRAGDNWIDNHAADIWVDGNHANGYTPLGTLANEIFPQMAGQTEVEKWDRALGMARRMMPTPAPRKTSQAARHRSAVAPTGSQGASLRERFDKAKTPQEEKALAMKALMEGSGYTQSPDD